MKALTARQAQVLDAIVSTMRQTGYCPTVREIGESVGLRSTRSVDRHLEALEQKGYIRRVPRKARHIKLIGDWWDANSVRVIGGCISGMRHRNFVRLEGFDYGRRDDGHLMEADLLVRLGMADDENGTVRSGRLWFEPDPDEGVVA